jgi:hypothetical protein
MNIPQAPGRVLKSQTVTGAHPSPAHRDRGDGLLCSGPGDEPRKPQAHPQAAGSDADAGEGPACRPSARECFDRERPAWPDVRTGNGSSGPGGWPSGRASWLTVLSHTLHGRRIQGKAPATGGCHDTPGRSPPLCADGSPGKWTPASASSPSPPPWKDAGAAGRFWPRRKSGRRAEGFLTSRWRPEQTTIAPRHFYERAGFQAEDIRLTKPVQDRR